MKILFLSDTHGLHQKLEDLPQADILIHSGDISNRGKDAEVKDFINWFSDQDYQYKVFIAGNHDFYFEGVTVERMQKLLPQDVYYLCDTGITIEGLNIWGSPVTPWFFDWAFNRKRGKDISRHWKLIPENTDILITHGPSFGILDRTEAGVNAGCEDLLAEINLIKPKYHLFGHIHEGYGMRESTHTTFVNGSILDENYIIKHQPITFEI